jgi:phosphoribosylaminoimidazole carboxylase PurE protein
MSELKVSVVMGSDSDLEVMQRTCDILQDFGIAYDRKIFSAHRTPEALKNYMDDVLEKGCKVFIAGAGCAAHLAGVVASHTICPVIGVPLEGSSLKGLDSLLSTVQMPGGVPVATVAIGKAGAKNAGLLAVQILAVEDKDLQEKLKAYKVKMAEDVIKKNEE